MPNDAFIAEVDKWLSQVRDECLRLHEFGVPSERLSGVPVFPVRRQQG